jgi:hypothetical protein
MGKWCREFEAGRSDVRDEIRSGRPSIVTDEIIQKIDEDICANRHLTIVELHQQWPEVSRTVLHEIFTRRFGCRKLFVHWVPKMMTDNHKKNRVDAV